MDAQPFDRAASLASSVVGSILDDLKAAQEPPHAAAASATAHGWSVVVIVTPAAPGDGLDHLTQCDRDCLALLAQCGLPVPVVRVRKLLEKRGIGVWGEATVKRSLSRLRRLKLVSNSRRGDFLMKLQTPWRVVGAGGVACASLAEEQGFRLGLRRQGC